MERTIENVKRGFEASLQMLETLESALEPMAPEGTGGFDLADTFRGHARSFLHGLIGADQTVTDAESEAYRKLFGEDLPAEAIEELADESRFREAAAELKGFLDWIGELEAKITAQIEGGGHLSGMTADLVDTLEMLGVTLFLDDEEDTDRAHRLKQSIQQYRQILHDRGLDSDDSVFDD